MPVLKMCSALFSVIGETKRKLVRKIVYWVKDLSEFKRRRRHEMCTKVPFFWHVSNSTENQSKRVAAWTTERKCTSMFHRFRLKQVQLQ